MHWNLLKILTQISLWARFKRYNGGYNGKQNNKHTFLLDTAAQIHIFNFQFSTICLCIEFVHIYKWNDKGRDNTVENTNIYVKER